MGFTSYPLYLVRSPAAVIVTVIMVNGSNNCFPITEENPGAHSVPGMEKLTGIIVQGKWTMECPWHVAENGERQNNEQSSSHQPGKGLGHTSVPVRAGVSFRSAENRRGWKSGMHAVGEAHRTGGDRKLNACNALYQLIHWEAWPSSVHTESFKQIK